MDNYSPPTYTSNIHIQLVKLITAYLSSVYATKTRALNKASRWLLLEIIRLERTKEAGRKAQPPACHFARWTPCLPPEITSWLAVPPNLNTNTCCICSQQKARIPGENQQQIQRRLTDTLWLLNVPGSQKIRDLPRLNAFILC